jgi:hypothetical protein
MATLKEHVSPVQFVMSDFEARNDDQKAPVLFDANRIGVFSRQPSAPKCGNHCQDYFARFKNYSITLALGS